MLEIFLVWRLAVRIGNQAAQKGFKKFGYQLMLVVLWICGELLSGVLGYVILGEANSFWITYILALLGAAFGAGIAFLIMRLLPKQSLSLRFRPKFALSPFIFGIGDVPNFGRKLRQVLM